MHWKVYRVWNATAMHSLEVFLNFLMVWFAVCSSEGLNQHCARGYQGETNPGTYNPNAATKVTILLVSVILTVAFPGLNLWFPHVIVMASLCRKWKLQSLLYAVLHAGHVLAHTGQHERKTSGTFVSWKT
jgi:hypothetical protein